MVQSVTFRSAVKDASESSMDANSTFRMRAEEHDGDRQHGQKRPVRLTADPPCGNPEAPHRPSIAPALGLSAGEVPSWYRRQRPSPGTIVMNAVLLIGNFVLLAAVLGLAFLVLGALRALGLVNFRLDQMEAMRPSRIGREGLKIGRKAPDFTLPSASGGERSLSEFAGRKVLLVLTQSGCGPCMEIVPELNRLHARDKYQVLVVNHGEPEATRLWVAETKATFPVLAQKKLSVSKRYEVFVTPFAFVIDEQGIITSKGIAGSRQYLGYVLTGAGNRPGHDEVEPAIETPDKSEPDDAVSNLTNQTVSS